MQSIGLTSLYGQSVTFQFAIKLIYSLTYVPAAEVRACFQDVVCPVFDDLQFEEWYDDNYFNKIGQFLSYIKQTWIGRPDRQPTYAIKTWNKHNEVLNDRCLTNNAVELFNSH